MCAFYIDTKNMSDSKTPATLVLDSRDRVAGSLDAFTVNLRPGLSGVKAVRLLWASVPNPVGNTQPYWLVRIPQFGLGVRAGSETDSSTWIIPVDSAQGYRSIFRESSDYAEVCLQQPSSDISTLDVRIMTRGGAPAGLGNEWFLVLGVSY